MTAIRRPAVPLEHRLTHPNASLGDLTDAIALVTRHELSALLVSPWLVKAARRELGRSPIQLGAVVGSPHGGQLLAVKAFEASRALEQGATHIEFVVNGGALRSGADETVFNDILGVVDMAHSALASAAMVVEAEPLGDELVARACRLAERAGVDLVATSTGTASAAETVRLARLLRDSVGPRVEVKAVGELTSVSQVRDAADAGAARVSARFSAELVGELGEASASDEVGRERVETARR
jgi:deoxyribose-phosphate aldolase